MDGLLIIDKPAGWTSHDVVARVRRLLKIKRVGHTGTLDPFATGVLVLMLGRATRLAQFLNADAKEYEATVRFGYATDTGDLTGARLEDSSDMVGNLMALDQSEFEMALAGLRGEIEQVPPMYSAKKIGGKRLYELARRGETLERKPVRVTISEFQIVPDEMGVWLRANDRTFDLKTRVVCSAGTYVRVLAEAVGERLGVGAHLSALRRTRAGDFYIKDAVTVDELERMAAAGAQSSLLLPPEAALSSMPFVHLSAGEARRALNGVAIPLRSEGTVPFVEGERVQMLDEGGNLLAVGVYESVQQRLRPQVVLALENKH